MKIGIAFLCATLGLGPAMAQCGRCGPDGGGDPPLRPRVTFRPQSPLALPDGLGSLQAQLRIDSLTPSEAAVRYPATAELLLDASMTRTVRVTEVVLRRGNSPITFSVTPASPLVLPAGRSTVVLRGSTLEASILDSGWTLFLRTDERTDGYTLNPSFSIEGSETVAMARLTPPRGLSAAMVSLRASYLRLASNAPISAAEIEYNVHFRAGNGAASLTGLSLLSVAAFGPTVIEAPLPATVVSAGNSGTLSFRQILDPSNAAAMAGFEAMLQNPTSLFVQLRTSEGSGGALLQRPESFTYAVESAVVPGSSTPAGATVTGSVTVEALRNPAGEVIAGLARFGLAARGFTRPGTAFTGITVDLPPVRNLTAQTAGNDVRTNDSGDTSLFQDYPLLGGDPLLTYLLTPASFSARLNTAVDALGAVTLAAKAPLPALSSPAMAITEFVPAVSTPGSIVSIFGRSFPARTSEVAVSIEDSLAEVLYTSPNQINVRLPQSLATATATSPLIRKTVQVLNLTQATVASRILMVDVAEPFILFGPAIYFAGTGNPVRPATPATAGDMIEIYCTGVTINTEITYSLLIGGRPISPVVPVALPGVPGVWVIRAAVPTGLTAGSQPVSVFANFANGRRFPRTAQEAPLAIR